MTMISTGDSSEPQAHRQTHWIFPAFDLPSRAITDRRPNVLFVSSRAAGIGVGVYREDRILLLLVGVKFGLGPGFFDLAEVNENFSPIKT
jgi:hypothetical protein